MTNDEKLTEVRIAEPVEVGLQQASTNTTSDQALWVAIRNRTEATGFGQYKAFIDGVLCPAEDDESERGSDATSYSQKGSGEEAFYKAKHIEGRRKEFSSRPTIQGVDAYNLLRLSTEVFLLLQAGVVLPKDSDSGTGYEFLDGVPLRMDREGDRLGRDSTEEEIAQLLGTYFGGEARLPYLKRILGNLKLSGEEGGPYCNFILQHRMSNPTMIELIWSYWHEEGMLEQTLHAVTRRFQNRRGPAETDPLANLELDPLRPLSNLLWGYVQDEYRRLTVVRRAYEYDHHYGLNLVGKAVPSLQSADSRSKFIEAFHHLLQRAAAFYREDADTTVVADGFPLLNALREVHLLLAEGAHNQFGDLPWTARVEMLLGQWLLARPEMQAFLRGRYMVPYQEEWMGSVDAMKRLQGWSDTTVTHFHSLAVFGERILLSIRYGDWIDLDNTHEQAKNWARYWRPEVQGYIHAYHAATGVDLAADPVQLERVKDLKTLPSTLLARRLGEQSGQVPEAAEQGEMARHGLTRRRPQHPRRSFPRGSTSNGR